MFYRRNERSLNSSSVQLLLLLKEENVYISSWASPSEVEYNTISVVKRPTMIRRNRKEARTWTDERFTKEEKAN